MVGAAERGHRDDRLAVVRPLPGGELLQRVDALVVEILADDEASPSSIAVSTGISTRAVAAAIGELHRMGDVADAEVALPGGDDLARLHAAAALDQLAVEPGFLEEADAVGDEMRLVERGTATG